TGDSMEWDRGAASMKGVLRMQLCEVIAMAFAQSNLNLFCRAPVIIKQKWGKAFKELFRFCSICFIIRSVLGNTDHRILAFLHPAIF
ncbi:MAG: hypothetical protein ACOCPW_04130, partial [Marinilabiliaceae bacterium]